MTQESQAPNEEFELMDREDEEQILAELRGVPVDKFIYKNNRGQWELSYAGTKWVIREMEKHGEIIRVKSRIVERCPIEPTEHIIVDVIAERVVNTDGEKVYGSQMGSARGWIKQKLNDGRVVPDEFFYNKTVSKATRNVMQALMNQSLKKELIDTLVKMQNGGAAPASPARSPQKKTQSAPQGAPPASGQTTPPPPPAGQAKGAGQQTAGQQTAGQAKPSSGAAQTSQTRQQQPAGQAPQNKKGDRLALVQRFNVVLKQATGAGPKEDKKAWGHLMLLTGASNPNEVPDETINALGPILNQVVKKTARLENGKVIAQNGAVLWPKEGAAAPAPAPQEEAPPPPQQDEGPPPSDADSPMF